MPVPEGVAAGTEACRRCEPSGATDRQLFEPWATVACSKWRAEGWRKRMEWPFLGWEWCGSKGLVLKQGSPVIPGSDLVRSTNFGFIRKDLLGHKAWLLFTPAPYTCNGVIIIATQRCVSELK